MPIEQGKLAIRDQHVKFVSKVKPLEPAMKDAFSGEPGLLRFTRDAAGKITGFDLSASRMRGIHFRPALREDQIANPPLSKALCDD